jgi:hypothetical protein
LKRIDDDSNNKNALQKAEIDIRSLNTSCALLVGLLTPLIRQNKDLVQQRNLFTGLYERNRKLLIDKCLSDSKGKKPTEANQAVFRFRKSVVVVLAANRLCYFNSVGSGKHFHVADGTIGNHYKFAFSQASNARPRTFAIIKKSESRRSTRGSPGVT